MNIFYLVLIWPVQSLTGSLCIPSGASLPCAHCSVHSSRWYWEHHTSPASFIIFFVINIFQAQCKIDFIIAWVNVSLGKAWMVGVVRYMNQDSGKQAGLHCSKVASVGCRMQGGRVGLGLDPRSMGSVGFRQRAAEPRGGQLCRAALSHAVLGHNGLAHTIPNCAMPCCAGMSHSRTGHTQL